MYRDVAFAVLISTFVLIMLDLGWRLLVGRQPRGTRRRISFSNGFTFQIVVDLFGFLTFVTIGGTGFYSLFSDARKLTGWALLMHLGAAPAFAVGAVLLALYWAQRNRFTQADWNRLRRPLRPPASNDSSLRALVLRKLFFWAALMLSIPAVFSITLAMFPLGDAFHQEMLIRVHRICVVPLAAAGLLFAYFALATRLSGGAD